MVTMRLRALALALVILATTVALPAAGRADEPLKAGDVLDKDTASRAEGLLPPEILRHYQDGKYANRIVDWPAGT